MYYAYGHGPKLRKANDIEFKYDNGGSNCGSSATTTYLARQVKTSINMSLIQWD
jgi:hypothetical protein